MRESQGLRAGLAAVGGCPQVGRPTRWAASAAESESGMTCARNAWIGDGHYPGALFDGAVSKPPSLRKRTSGRLIVLRRQYPRPFGRIGRRLCQM
jgi:hypothetical protein